MLKSASSRIDLKIFAFGYGARKQPTIFGEILALSRRGEGWGRDSQDPPPPWLRACYSSMTAKNETVSTYKANDAHRCVVFTGCYALVVEQESTFCCLHELIPSAITVQCLLYQLNQETVYRLPVKPHMSLSVQILLNISRINTEICSNFCL